MSNFKGPNALFKAASAALLLVLTTMSTGCFVSTGHNHGRGHNHGHHHRGRW